MTMQRKFSGGSDWGTLREKWLEFCRDVGFEMLGSQRVYMNEFFQTRKIVGRDRCTGKTVLMQKFVEFNHHFGFFQIYFSMETRNKTRNMQQNLRHRLGTDALNCIFVDPDLEESRKYPHLEIRDMQSLFVEYRE